MHGTDRSRRSWVDEDVWVRVWRGGWGGSLTSCHALPPLGSVCSIYSVLILSNKKGSVGEEEGFVAREPPPPPPKRVPIRHHVPRLCLTVRSGGTGVTPLPSDRKPRFRPPCQKGTLPRAR